MTVGELQAALQNEFQDVQIDARLKNLFYNLVDYNPVTHTLILSDDHEIRKEPN